MARKSPAEKLKRIQQTIDAWEGHGRHHTLHGMTLHQFNAAVRPSKDARRKVADLERRLAQAIRERNSADARSMRLVKNVGYAVAGHPELGQDSDMYEAMGYVRRSARRKRRKRA